jgi:hypothetical protein
MQCRPRWHLVHATVPLVTLVRSCSSGLIQDTGVNTQSKPVAGCKARWMKTIAAHPHL